ncbi:MAG TPA: EamA family transporter [Geminicoccaceae bacterium]|nr:EamA family transporter [Geminicoccaceae bacterium]
MLTVLLGIIAALGWGIADFIARTTSRRLGTEAALAGMLAASAVALGLLLLAVGSPPPVGRADLALVGLTGLALASATLLLYRALSRGPIAVAAPIAAAYPCLNLGGAVLQSHAPTPGEWLALAAVLAGVILVARPPRGEEGEGDPPTSVAPTVLLAMGAAVCFACSIELGQAAARRVGELAATTGARWAALLLAVALLAARQSWPRLSGRGVALPLVVVQGLLDGAAYLALFAAARRPGAVVAVVVASGFAAVTVLLARLLLRERLGAGQWTGTALVVGGVGALAALRA